MQKLVAVVFLVASLTSCESGTKIVEITPNFGNVAGNDQVVLNGTGFKSGMEVRFGKKDSRSVVIESSTRIIVKTPAGVEGKVDVIVTRDDGRTFVLRDGFTFRRDIPTGK
jgi:large repetitive protein